MPNGEEVLLNSYRSLSAPDAKPWPSWGAGILRSQRRIDKLGLTNPPRIKERAVFYHEHQQCSGRVVRFPVHTVLRIECIPSPLPRQPGLASGFRLKLRFSVTIKDWSSIKR